jgi:hypothetical protein
VSLTAPSRHTGTPPCAQHALVDARRRHPTSRDGISRRGAAQCRVPDHHLRRACREQPASADHRWRACMRSPRLAMVRRAMIRARSCVC